MHAAEANTPNSPHPPMALSSTLVALPTASESVQMALAYTRQQQETLGQIAEVLSHMAQLAHQGQRHEATDQQRLELHLQFLERANALGRLAQATYHDQPLFARRDWAVDLDPPGNKLVVPGIYRTPERSTGLQQADLLSPRSAEETHRRILELLDWAAIDQALVNEIRARLSFVATASRT